MAGEIPAGVHVGPHGTEVEPPGIEIEETPEVRGLEPTLHLPKGVVEQEHMAHHQDAVSTGGMPAEILGFAVRDSHRFFHQHMLAVRKCGRGKRCVRRRRRGDDHPVDRRIAKVRLEVGRGTNAVPGFQGLPPGGIGLHDRHEPHATVVEKCSDDVRPPVPRPAEHELDGT